MGPGEALEDNSIRTHEQEIELPSGEIRSILTSMQRISIQDTDAVLYSFIDITERVEAELEIYRLSVEGKTIEQKERQRIARLLHDDLQQRLFAIKIHLEESLHDKGGHSASVELAKPIEWLAEAITMTRQLGEDLSPLNLREDNLVAGILSLSSQMKDQYGLDVELIDKGFKHQFHEEVQITLLQAVRELLFNVVKHSGSLAATVTLEQVNEDWFGIIVSDAGKGFDSKTMSGQSKGGRGLRIIQQELELFGCLLEINSGEKKEHI
jgi:signal transduction histidine kinase